MTNSQNHRRADLREAVIIIGANALQNDLMAGFLEKEIAIPCFALGDGGPPPAALPELKAQQLLCPVEGFFPSKRSVVGGLRFTHFSE